MALDWDALIKEAEQEAGSQRASPAAGLGGLAQRAVETAGGFGGPLFGAAYGASLGAGAGAVGMLAGGALGAGLGLLAGSSLPEITRPFFTGTPPKPLGQTLHDVAVKPVEVFGTQLPVSQLGLTMLGEIGGQALGAGITRALGGRRLATDPTAVRVQQTLQPAGGQLTLGQLTTSRAVDLAENIATPALLGGKAVRQLKEGQAAAVKQLTDDMIATLQQNAGPDDLAALIKNQIETGKGIARAIERRMFKDVDDLSAGVKVDTSALVEFIEDKGGKGVREALDIAASGLKGGWRALLTTQASPNRIFLAPGTRSVLHVPGQDVPEVTFVQAREALSRLKDVARMPARTLADEGPKRAAGVLVRMLEDAMERAASSAGSRAFEAYKDAAKVTATKYDLYGNTFIRELARTLEQRPSRLLAQLMRTDTETLRALERAAPEVWPRVQARIAEQLLIGARNISRGGELDGARLINRIAQLDAKSAGMSQAALGPDTAEALRRLGEAAMFIRRRPPEGTGLVFIQLGQATAASALLWLKLTPYGTAVILGPYLASKIVANPKAIRALTEGLRPGIGVQQLSRLAGQLAPYELRNAQEPHAEPGS